MSSGESDAGRQSPHLDDVCDDGDHALHRNLHGVRACKKCGLSAQTLDTHFDHDI